MINLKHSAILCAGALLAACQETPATTCDRDCLIQIAEASVGAAEISADARVTENGQDIDWSDSWASGATSVNVHNAYVDSRDSGQVMIAGTAVGADGEPAMFGLRARVLDGAPTELEWLVARDGQASLFPREIPIPTDARFGDLVPEEQRTSAERMIELADIYFDGIETNDGAALPVTEGCNRVENGFQTTRSSRFGDIRCNSLEPFVYIPVVEQRRYPIVDEERGVVAGVVMFQIPGGDYERIIEGETVIRSYEPRSLYLFEAFKVIDSEVDQIEATMRNLDYGEQINWPSP